MPRQLVGPRPISSKQGTADNSTPLSLYPKASLWLSYKSFASWPVGRVVVFVSVLEAERHFNPDSNGVSKFSAGLFRAP